MPPPVKVTKIPETILSALQAGQYSLLLGAGASADALSANGKFLPLGDSYGTELISQFGLQISQNTALQNVWDAAVMRAGSEGIVRAQSLLPRFTGCKPAPYHVLFSQFVWKRIFTFNVDDVLPKAYATQSSLQTLVETHFEEPYSDPQLSEDRVQLIYMHGAAGMPERTVVFGPPAYSATINNQQTWFHVFADLFLNEPFIVVGASLREPDFESYLAQKRRVTSALQPPSLYINKSIDDAALAICQRFDLIPVELTGGEFLGQLLQRVPQREKRSASLARTLGPLSLITNVDSISDIAAVAEQFSVIGPAPASWPTSDEQQSHFYEGYDATWSDIRESKDVVLDSSAELVRIARAQLEGAGTHRVEVAILSDNAATGKTTTLMRVAATLGLEGRSVLFFRGQNRLNDQALGAVLARERTGIVLVVDRIADHANQLARLISAYPQPAGRLMIIGAERRGHERVLRQRFPPYANFINQSALDRRQAEDLANKLRAAVKLGTQAGKTNQELAELFVGTSGRAYGGQLLTILLEVTKEHRLIDRLTDEWKHLSDHARAVYNLVCLSSACGYPMRTARLHSALSSRVDASQFTQMIAGGELKGLARYEVQSGEAVVLPRHRRVAETVLESCVGEDELFATSLRLASVLAPYVNPVTVRRGNPDARLARELMDEDGQVVVRFKKRAEEWYQQLQSLYEWNSRYWEQRSLNAMRSGNRSRARDFARTGLAKEPRHWQPQTTLARVLVDSAERDTQLSQREKETAFLEAVGLLDSAILGARYEGRHDPHPYHLLFDVCVRIGRKLFSGLPADLVRVLNAHAGPARNHHPRDLEIRNALVQLARDGIG